MEVAGVRIEQQRLPWQIVVASVEKSWLPCLARRHNLQRRSLFCCGAIEDEWFWVHGYLSKTSIVIVRCQHECFVHVPHSRLDSLL